MPDTVNAKDTLDSYITDMLALEEHIAKAVDAQLVDFRKEHPAFAGVLSTISATTARHIGALEALKTSRHIDSGSMVADAVKRAGSVVAGLGCRRCRSCAFGKTPEEFARRLHRVQPRIHWIPDAADDGHQRWG